MSEFTNLAGFAAYAKPLIDRTLRTEFRKHQTSAKLQNAEYYDLVHELSVLAVRGGKRLRPMLCLLAYQGYGGKQKTKVLSVAVTVELLHMFLLIHDDIIDRDRQRWGGYNIAGVYFERFSRTMPAREALHAAESRALLAGDICMAMATDMLAASEYDPATVLAAQRLLQKVSLEVIGGQLADIGNSQNRKLPSEEQILSTYRSKTASYSFRLPLQLGALMAGAPDSELLKLDSLADKLGTAFQLEDDLLGVFGSESQTGKSTLSDLREGKQTLLMHKTLELAPMTHQRTMRSILGNDSIGQTELKQARQIITDCGAYNYISQLAVVNIAEASKEIESTALEPTSARLLIELATSLIHRNK